MFTLLETLYGAMDTAAKRMGVFKVETVSQSRDTTDRAPKVILDV